MSYVAQTDFQAQLAQVLAVKLIEAEEAGALSFYSDGNANTRVSDSALDSQDVPSQGTPSVASDSEDSSFTPRTVSSKRIAQPRLLALSELSHIDWSRLAKAQEWRTVLQLKGLPPKLCRREALEALLEAHGLAADVQKVRTSIKLGSKLGSAVLHATSTEAVSRLCRFFHGRQFVGSRVPISVSFADGQVNRPSTAKFPAKLGEPKRINSEIFAAEDDGTFVAPPPGLEDLALRSPSWGMQMPAYA